MVLGLHVLMWNYNNLILNYDERRLMLSSDLRNNLVSFTSLIVKPNPFAFPPNKRASITLSSLGERRWSCTMGLSFYPSKEKRSIKFKAVPSSNLLSSLSNVTKLSLNEQMCEIAPSASLSFQFSYV